MGRQQGPSERLVWIGNGRRDKGEDWAVLASRHGEASAAAAYERASQVVSPHLLTIGALAGAGLSAWQLRHCACEPWWPVKELVVLSFAA